MRCLPISLLSVIERWSYVQLCILISPISLYHRCSSTSRVRKTRKTTTNLSTKQESSSIRLSSWPASLLALSASPWPSCSRSQPSSPPRCQPSQAKTTSPSWCSPRHLPSNGSTEGQNLSQTITLFNFHHYVVVNSFVRKVWRNWN